MQNRFFLYTIVIIVLCCSFFYGCIYFTYEQVKVTINPAVQYQTTEGRGTSLCWFGNVIGRWSDTNKNAIAGLLFDTEQGLGLNLIRYNIGGGDTPDHEHMNYGKEMEGFKSSESGPYNWDADPGQRWILLAAKARIPESEFITEAFSNSPPLLDDRKRVCFR